MDESSLAGRVSSSPSEPNSSPPLLPPLAEMRRLDDPYRFWNQPDDGLEVPALKDRIKKPKKPRKPKNK